MFVFPKFVKITLVLYIINFIFVRTLRNTVSRTNEGFNTRCGDQYVQDNYLTQNNDYLTQSVVHIARKTLYVN